LRSGSDIPHFFRVEEQAIEMELVWTALGICVIVGFVFFVFAQYWQRLLLHHSRAIRELSERVQALEAMDDPALRQRISDSAPSPLEQVFTFGLRLEEKFWKETLHASAQEIAYVKANGRFLGSVKIERWRSHSVVTVSEIQPQSKSAEWTSRSIDVYSGKGPDGMGPVTLWELPLAPNAKFVPEAAPCLELRLDENALELCALHGRFGLPHGNGGGSPEEEYAFFRLPLDAAQLGEFRRAEADDMEALEGSASGQPLPGAGNSWIAYFAHRDERRGVDWQLCIRDLGKKEEWERWKVWEPWGVQ
jgi:hypothetical protein